MRNAVLFFFICIANIKMEDYVGVGMSGVPINDDVHWTAISFEEYVDDMGMDVLDLSRQVRVDVPRMHVTLCDAEGRSIRVHSGEVLEGLLRSLFDETKVNSILSFLTQTSLAAPVRALSRVLPEEMVVSEHNSQRELKIDLCVDDTHAENEASIRVQKTLSLRNVESMQSLCDVHLTIEASTREEGSRRTLCTIDVHALPA